MNKPEPVQPMPKQLDRNDGAKVIIGIGWLLAIYPCIKIIQIAAGLGALSIEVDGEDTSAALIMIIAIFLVICMVGAPFLAGMGHARKSLELRVLAVLAGIPAVLVASFIYLQSMS